MENLVLICCLHGDERYGLKVSKSQSLFPFVLANEKAFEENKRFIDSDLNRSFPGNTEGNYEERRAVELLKKIKDFEYVLDLHSSSNSCPLFGIITKPNKEKIDFAKKLGLKRLVIMSPSFVSGKSLIDFAKCGISLEIGPHGRKENINEVLELINHFAENKNFSESLEIFEIFALIKKQAKNILITNFKEVKQGEIISEDETGKQLAEYDFIPVIVGEEAYGDTLCLAARKLDLDNLYKSLNPELNMTKKEEFKVTPYEATGEVDYEKLIRDFGVEKLDSKLLDRIKKHTGELHFLLRRKIFFAHRDMNWLLDEYEKGNKFFLYTGRAPSGKIHLGHLLPWVFCKWLQDKFGAELWFQFPDEEKFLFKQELTYEKSQEYLQDNMLDVAALGFDPKKTHFLIDTKNANLMYPEAIKVAKKITFSTIKASFGFTDSNNIGSIFYTSMQAVPAFLPSVIHKKIIPCLIPLGVDQDTHFRISRDVIPKLGYPKPAIIHCTFLPPLSAVSGKMSASAAAETAIYTTDSAEEVKKKINKYAFSGGRDTLEEHRKLGGNPDIDVSFQYLRMFFEDDDKKLEKIEKAYRSGKLLSGELKAILIEKINTFLKEHQKKREEAKKHLDKFLVK
jgi:tryptophanyl-tRNA synthetase